MEKDILKQIYFGEVVPWENRNDKTPEMMEIADRIDDGIERLKERLDNEGKKLLEKLLDDSSELENKTICEGFKDGFRLGVQIMAAALGDGKKP